MGIDLIITDAGHVDRMAVDDYTLDCAWGADENDFELTIDRNIPSGAYTYLDGSECGGVVDALRDRLDGDGSTLTYSGRTWHGMLAGKILAPDIGQDYLTVQGPASTVIGQLLNRIGLAGTFTASQPPSGPDPTVGTYQFDRYTDAYTGMRKMCAASGLKLRLAYRSGSVNIWAEPVEHYGDTIDSDLVDFDATRTWRHVNHLIGLGKGDLKDRVVSHWYADAKGNVSQRQTFTGVDEIAQVYDYNNAEADELAKSTREKLEEMQSEGDVSVTIRNPDSISLDVGDTVAARDNITGITVNATITKKIVKIAKGSVSVDYEAE
ncbi:hypothetical protein CS006_10350 [Bifidobacterium primatium]|uniref:Uncharacterized protein n=1 Tax=Bifidobacterium primatium TaxID=2045438 RepID=A0A2M9H686_9BIFI|nr:hypothetical protein [Bifidobacterium primatium]PJM72329.1 hypothetical protein CS006_10350 [Bifidobacterium primatium]